MQRVCVTTLGCKVNQFESAALETGFAEAGCTLVALGQEADLVVVNTCAVTGRASQQSRQLVRRIRRQYPQAQLVVTGCHAQIAAREIREITEGQVCIIGNNHKDTLVTSVLKRSSPGPVLQVDDIGQAREICHLVVRRVRHRTRAYLKIQDGCNNFCSYCIVPYTRGRCRSLPRERIRKQVALYTAAGYRELVVTGINVGRYGVDLAGQDDLYGLLDWLCRTWPEIRFRLSSIEPVEVNERLVALLTTYGNFMPHLHLPLQSGDDRVLARMGRRYRVADCLRAVETIQELLPETAIGCDIMAGFPGEDEQAARATRRLLETLGLAYLHVFPYSRRPGTPAAAMTGQVPPAVRTERVQRLRALDALLRRRFCKRHLGTVQPVLLERRQQKTGLLQGYSGNYIPVYCVGDDQLVGQVVPVRLEECQDKGVRGGIVSHVS